MNILVVEDDMDINQLLCEIIKKIGYTQGLINNFFLLSAADSDELPLSLERLNATTLIKEIVLSYYHHFQEVNKQPKINITNKDLFILADESSFKRVIDNLILNAIQHSASDIEVSMEQVEDSVCFLVVNDLREGEKPDTNRMFERFYTVDETRKKSHGLGLAIVKSLMEKMDGKIVAKVEDRKIHVICQWKLIDY